MHTSTPLPTSAIDIPQNEVYSWLATAAANVNALPSDISAPGGVSLLVDENAQQIFGYGKWLFSPAAAENLAGRTFSPLVTHAFVAVTLAIVLAMLRQVIDFVVFLGKGVIFVVRQVLKFVPGLGVFMFAQGWPATPTPFVLPDAPSSASLTIPSGYGMWYWAPEAIARWNSFGDRGQVIQVAMLIMLVVSGIFLITRYARGLNGRTRDGDDE
jgi:hypothetical protein